MAKRVAIFLPSLIGGGAERSARFVGQALDRAGYAIDYVVSVAKGELLHDPFIAPRLVRLNAWNELTSLPAYVRYLRARRPDLVISFVHSANLISGLGAQIVRDIPFIVSVRNTLVKRPADQWWVRRWLGLGPERRLYARARFIHTVSREVADQCSALLAAGDRLVMTQNTAEELDGTRPAPDAAAVAEARDMTPFLLALGRLVPIKGFDTLIRAFARARPPEPWRLVIVGEGPQRAGLEALAQSLGVSGRVSMIGYRADPRPWLKAASGFVFPSRGEGFGRVSHEALLAGLPVAGGRCPGVTEMLGDGRFGRLIDPEDVEGFAQAITDIVEGRLTAPDPAALERHLAQYRPDVVARRYVAMVEAAIGAP